MDLFSSKSRPLTIGALSLAILFSAPIFEASGQSQALHPALDGNRLAKALHHKTFRRTAIQGVNLAWAPSPSSPNIDGYRIYYGTASGNYSEHLDVGMVTTAKVPNATSGGTYFYVVVAYKGALESAPSNEVATTGAAPAPTPPLIATDTPTLGATPTPAPTPEPGARAPVPMSGRETIEPLVAADPASASPPPTLRFQRRLQRLGLPQSKGSDQHEGAGAATAEPAPK